MPSTGTSATSGSADGAVILVPGRDPLSRAGGSESYGAALGKAAIMAGFQPHLFTVARRPAVIETEFGVVHRIGSPIPPRMMSSWLYQRAITAAIVGFVGERPGPHIAHGLGSWTGAAVAASRQLGRRGIRCVPVATAFTTILHETEGKLKDPFVREQLRARTRYLLELALVRTVSTRIEGRIYRASAAVVVNYDNVRALLEAAFGPDLPVRTLPYAAPLAFDDPPARPPLPDATAGFGEPDAPLVVSTSRHDGRKGLDVLIRALARLRDAGRPFRACILGKGELLEAHRRLVRSLALEQQVLLPGQVPAILPYVANADVFVLPSLEEGSGAVSVLEALQCGTPIVASAIDGIPEDLTDGEDPCSSRRETSACSRTRSPG